MGRALSIGVEDVRPSRDVQSLLIPESPGFRRGEYVNEYIKKNYKKYNLEGSVRLLKVAEDDLDKLEDYGFTEDNGIYYYDFGNFGIRVNSWNIATQEAEEDGIVSLDYTLGDIDDSVDTIEMPEVIYLLIKDGVVDVC